MVQEKLKSNNKIWYFIAVIVILVAVSSIGQPIPDKESQNILDICKGQGYNNNITVFNTTFCCYDDNNIERNSTCVNINLVTEYNWDVTRAKLEQEHQDLQDYYDSINVGTKKKQ